MYFSCLKFEYCNATISRFCGCPMLPCHLLASNQGFCTIGPTKISWLFHDQIQNSMTILLIFLNLMLLIFKTYESFWKWSTALGGAMQIPWLFHDCLVSNDVPDLENIFQNYRSFLGFPWPTGTPSNWVRGIPECTALLFTIHFPA